MRIDDFTEHRKVRSVEWEIIMIDFDEELKQFSPSLGVSQAEEDILSSDLKDISDIVLQMTEDLRGVTR